RLLQAIAGQAADDSERLTLGRGPVLGQPEASQAGAEQRQRSRGQSRHQQEGLEVGHDGLTRPTRRNGSRGHLGTFGRSLRLTGDGYGSSGRVEAPTSNLGWIVSGSGLAALFDRHPLGSALL